jgi:hypothetical protein
MFGETRSFIFGDNMRLLLAVCLVLVLLRSIAFAGGGYTLAPLSKHQHHSEGAQLKEKLALQPPQPEELTNGCIDSDLINSSSWWCLIKDNNEQITAISTVVIAAFTFLLYLVSRNTARRQLRAYVLVKKARVDNLAVGQRPSVTVTLVNSGLTPARDFRQWYNIGVDSLPCVMINPSDSRLEDLNAHTLAGGGKIFHAQTLEKEIPPEAMGQFISGQAAVVFVGAVFYKDIFGRQRVTRYKLFSTLPIVDGSASMAAYKDGNLDT